MKKIYINVAVMGSVNEVLNKILNKIDESGLYDFCDNIILVINGDYSLLDFKLKDKYIIHQGEELSRCEFPTIDLIWNDSQSEDNTILYLHTKGVSKPNHLGVRDWTDFLIYFNIERWRDMVSALEYNDAVGVNHWGNPNDLNEHPSTWGYGKAPLHFSGNFWWSKSSHIRKLKRPYDFIPDTNYFRWRVACEMWVCSTDGMYKSLWNSEVNHYTTLYPRHLYQG